MSGMKNNAAILIPSYNESKAIGGLVSGLIADGYRVYVVDDGSTDNTASIALASGAIIVSHEVNRGKGESLKSGFRRIANDGFGFALVMDGDGQHHAEDIGRFFAAMSTTTGIVIGNRMTDTRKMPFVRKATNYFMSLLISLIARQWVPDTQCGFRLVRLVILDSITLHSSNYEAESELLIKTSRKGWKIASVPVSTIYGNETSGIRPFRDTLRFFALLIRLPFDKT